MRLPGPVVASRRSGDRLLRHAGAHRKMQVPDIIPIPVIHRAVQPRVRSAHVPTLGPYCHRVRVSLSSCLTKLFSGKCHQSVGVRSVGVRSVIEGVSGGCQAGSRWARATARSSRAWRRPRSESARPDSILDSSRTLSPSSRVRAVAVGPSLSTTIWVSA